MTTAWSDPIKSEKIPERAIASRDSLTSSSPRAGFRRAARTSLAMAGQSLTSFGISAEDSGLPLRVSLTHSKRLNLLKKFLASTLAVLRKDTLASSTNKLARRVHG